MYDLPHRQVLCTPHLGANTAEAQERVAKDIASQIVQASKGGALVGLVNAPALASATSAACRPWLQLAEALGTLARKVTPPADGTPYSVALDLHGESRGMERI